MGLCKSLKLKKDHGQLSSEEKSYIRFLNEIKKPIKEAQAPKEESIQLELF